MRQIIWTCGFLWLAGCEIPADVKSQIACTTVCTCFAGPNDVEECTEECIADGDLGALPEDCFECIQTHANQCSTLEDDCEALCDGPDPEPPVDLPDGVMQ